MSSNSNSWSNAAANNAEMATPAALTTTGKSSSSASFLSASLAPPPATFSNTTGYILLVVIGIIIIYYVLFSTLGMNSSTATTVFEFVLWGSFIVLILLNGMAYIFNIDVLQSLKHLFDPVEPPPPIVIPTTAVSELEPIPQLPTAERQQVFHIADNRYGFEDAKAICAAYGSRLASIKDLDDAYSSGADFCSYGWSDGQMALYPTQYAKWEQLQKIDGHHHDCGRPGINGGYISNPNVRFGVNCFGVKPPGTVEDISAMTTASLYPKSQKESQFDKKVDFWRNNIDDLQLSPFNQTQWSA